MTDRYQPLRDAIADRLWPVGDSFQRNMRLVEELLKERDALRDAADMALNVLIGCVVAGDGADDQRSMLEAQSMLRAALADGEGQA